MQLDTGATVTLLGETTWEDIDYPKLQPSDIKLAVFTNYIEALNTYRSRGAFNI